MRIAIKGGGIYGCTVALKLAHHDVTVYETNEVMMGASYKNFRRIHHGFHYPNSIGTALACRRAAWEFRDFYRDFVRPIHTVYAIANHGSSISPDEYMAFCMDLGEPHNVVLAGEYGILNCRWGAECEEAIYDPEALRAYFGENLKFQRGVPWDYDWLIDCTYTASQALEGVDATIKETMVIMLDVPVDGARTVLEGPFCGVIHTVQGKTLLYHADIYNPFEALVDAKRYFEFLKNAKISGFWEQKHVHLKTRERPSLVVPIGERHLGVISGKVAQCLDVAEEIKRIIDGGHPVSYPRATTEPPAYA